MLDPTMTYSCAVFDDPDAPLEEAQRNKLELVCEKLELGPADRVLEVGTGWGSFALSRGGVTGVPYHHDDDLSRAARLCPAARCASRAG